MTRYDDSAEIAARLTKRIEGVLDALNPGWVPHKGKAYLTAKGPKALGSFQVNLSGQHRGTWYRFSQQVGGGPIALVSYLITGNATPSKDDYRRAFDWARDFLGMARAPAESEHDRLAREERRAREQQDRERRLAAEAERDASRRARRATDAAGIFAEARSIRGTPAEAYLVARGIPPVDRWPWSPDGTLAYHEAVDYELDRAAGDWPALIGLVKDAFGSPTAIWQIYLDRERPTKAPLPNAKVGRGPVSGGAVRIGGDGPRIGMAEGVETALSQWVLHRFRFPVWAGLSTAYANFDPPVFVERVDVFPDGDKAVFGPTGAVQAPPGIAAANRLAGRLRPMGIKVVVNEPALDGDGNDFLMDWGMDL